MPSKSGTISAPAAAAAPPIPGEIGAGGPRFGLNRKQTALVRQGRLQDWRETAVMTGGFYQLEDGGGGGWWRFLSYNSYCGIGNTGGPKNKENTQCL